MSDTIPAGHSRLWARFRAQYYLYSCDPNGVVDPNIVVTSRFQHSDLISNIPRGPVFGNILCISVCTGSSCFTCIPQKNGVTTFKIVQTLKLKVNKVRPWRSRRLPTLFLFVKSCYNFDIWKAISAPRNGKLWNFGNKIDIRKMMTWPASAKLRRVKVNLCLYLRGAHGQQPAGDPSCGDARVQGYHLPLQDHAGFSRAAACRLGYSLACRWNSRSKKSWDCTTNGISKNTVSRNQPKMQRIGLAVRQRVGGDDRAHRFLAGHGASLRHPTRSPTWKACGRS